MEYKEQTEERSPKISIIARNSGKKGLRQVISYYKSTLLKWNPRIDLSTPTTHSNDLGSIGESPVSNVQRCLKNVNCLKKSDVLPLNKFMRKNFKTLLANIDQTLPIDDKGDSDKGNIKEVLIHILKKRKPLKIYDNLNLTQYKKFMGNKKFLPELTSNKKETHKLHSRAQCIQTTRKKSLENITKRFWSQINPGGNKQKSKKPVKNIITISKYIESFRVPINRIHNVRTRKLIEAKKLFSADNLSMVLQKINKSRNLESNINTKTNWTQKLKIRLPEATFSKCCTTGISVNEDNMYRNENSFS